MIRKTNGQKKSTRNTDMETQISKKSPENINWKA